MNFDTTEYSCNDFCSLDVIYCDCHAKALFGRKGAIDGK